MGARNLVWMANVVGFSFCVDNHFESQAESLARGTAYLERISGSTLSRLRILPTL